MVRPKLSSLLPAKRILNRILFDNDSRLPYKKMVATLDGIYSKLDQPLEIKVPKYIKSSDLMTFKDALATIRTTTKSINKNLVDLENELVEQAAELGNNNAITILAFEAISSPNTSKEDYKHANDLIRQLTDIKHPLVFKMAGDLAFSKGYHEQAKNYWEEFLQLEKDTIMASQVYSKLGTYYFNYLKPRPDLSLAKSYFEKAIAFGNLDQHVVQAHYYLGQIYTITNPKLSKYHLEISASKGLKESFQSLGFLEMNVFQNYSKSIEWFNLGVELSNDIGCMVGQFDCHIKLKDYKGAFKSLQRLQSIDSKIKNVIASKNIPQEMQETININQGLIKIFFRTRKSDITTLDTKLA